MQSSEDYSQVFEASWRSITGIVVIGLCTIAFSCLVFAAVNARPVTEWIMTIAAVLVLWLAWFMGRPLLVSRPVLRVDAVGLAFSSPKSGALRWCDVMDIREESVPGHVQLVVLLTPATGAAARNAWWISPVTERRISLATLKQHDVLAAVEAAKTSFALYRSDSAGQAMQVWLEELKAAVEIDARMTRITPVTWGLDLVLALNVGVWIANIATGMSALKPMPSELLAWGANSASSVMEDHEYWRLLTATFLHGGLMHLVLNMFGLWSTGVTLNRLYGNTQFLLIYFVSALTGSALSLHFAAQHSVSIGASGAVFGVLGAALLALWRNRDHLYGVSIRNVLIGQGVFLVYALGQGFIKDGIDNAAHMGGLLAGCLLAWFLVAKIDEQTSAGKRQKAAVAGAAFCALAIVALVVSTPAPTVHHRQIFEVQAEFNRLLPELLASEKNFQADLVSVRKKSMTEAQFNQAIETTYLPARKKIKVALAAFVIPDNDTAGAGMRDIKHANDLMVKMLQLRVDSAHAPADETAAYQTRIKAAATELSEVVGRINQHARAGNKKP